MLRLLNEELEYRKYEENTIGPKTQTDNKLVVKPNPINPKM